MKFGKLARAFRSVAIAIVLVAGTVPSEAANITYDVNQTIGTGTLTGTITTNGTIGQLSVLDVTAWNLTMTNGAATRTLNLSNSVFNEVGLAFTSTSTGLFFNFGSSAQEYAYFEGSGSNPGLTCLIATNPVCGNVSGGHTWSIQPNFPNSSGATSSSYNSNVQIASVSASAVPGPLAGAGLPGLILACGGLLGWMRRARR